VIQAKDIKVHVDLVDFSMYSLPSPGISPNDSEDIGSIGAVVKLGLLGRQYPNFSVNKFLPSRDDLEKNVRLHLVELLSSYLPRVTIQIGETLAQTTICGQLIPIITDEVCYYGISCVDTYSQVVITEV